MRPRTCPTIRFAAIFLLILAALAATRARADVRLPALFSDHVVLQQKTAVPIWGWAEPDERVTVSLFRAGSSEALQSVTTTAAEDRRWRVTLDPLDAGGPFSLEVRGRNVHRLEDVLVGEVWICSGQSNMQWAMRWTRDAREEIHGAEFPRMRLFHVPHRSTETEQTDVTAKWQPCTPKTVPGFSAVAYFFGRELHRKLGVPVGLIHSSWGGTPAEAWTRRSELERHAVLKPILDRYAKAVTEWPRNKLRYEKKLADWRAAVDAAKKAGKPGPRGPWRPYGPGHHWAPSGLWCGMIAPLVPYAFQGVIWYQGEGNATRAFQYRTLFPAMIGDWRRAWGRGDFPFLFVQLANHRPRHKRHGRDAWAELREAQTLALALPRTGMAVTIDIGNPTDVHPRNKQDVGRRLALWARAITYGEDVVHSGPVLEKATVEGGAIRLRFKHAGGGLVARGGKLTGFEIASADGPFVPARAALGPAEDGTGSVTGIEVSSPEVEAPAFVRYAWADNPEANLYNREGLPAVPFRTDRRPGITEENL